MARRKRAAQPLYYALVVPGIEDLAAEELRAIGAEVRETLARFDKRDSVLVFTIEEPGRLERCGLIDDAFALLVDAPTPPARSGPKQLAALLERPSLERAMVTHHSMRPKQRGRSFSVVARMAGKQQFHREDIDLPFKKALSLLLPHWVPTNDDSALEVWVHVIGERTIVGLRLSGDEMAQRTYKKAHLPASLKPTVARALVVLSEPRPGDIVLDPMAGAGTIVRERADAGRARIVLGGDMDPLAVGAAHTNCGRTADVARWDATRLPLRDASVDAVITNPPYGRQHEVASGLDRIYARSTREAARVLRNGGRCVVLTGELDTLMRALPPTLVVRAKRRMLLRGLSVTALTLTRVPR